MQIVGTYTYNARILQYGRIKNLDRIIHYHSFTGLGCFLDE